MSNKLHRIDDRDDVDYVTWSYSVFAEDMYYMLSIVIAYQETHEDFKTILLF